MKSRVIVPRPSAHSLSVILCALFTLSIGIVQGQQQPNPAEARMRDALKKLTQRIAEADAATAVAQAAQLAAEAKVTGLEAKVTELSKSLKDETAKGKTDKETSQKALANIEAKLANKEKEVALLLESLGKWKEGFNKARDVANAKEDERAVAAGKVIVLERQVAEHERKNREMYKAGMEILERYKGFGLGTALLAKEPFVGAMRVKFQNYAQDYGDKLGTQQIKPGESKEVEGKPKVASPSTKP